ncbi:MAG: ABC transporter substrate-binding protein [Campylobacteraceae bacterium]
MRKSLLFAILVSLFFIGCDKPKSEVKVETKPETKVETPKVKDEIVISVGPAITEGGFDPILGYGQHDPDIFHSTLLKFDENIELQNDLAKSYEISEDKKVYTFKIRDDVKFSDGKPLTANDIAFTYQKAKESGSLVDLTTLEKVEALDDFTVKFTLGSPWSVFLRSVAFIGIVPKHAYTNDYGMKPIGSKAYKIAELKPKEQLILVPNEYYYGKKPFFKKVTIVNIDEDSILATAKSGKFDVLMINPEFAKEKIEGMNLVNLKTVDTRGFNLPVVKEFVDETGLKRGNNVTSDIAIRHALNIGINRQNIINNALNGIGDVAYSRTRNLPWTQDKPIVSDNRVEEAIKILENAGWILNNQSDIREKNGVKAEFIITGRVEELQRYNLAVALSEEAKKLGINIIAKAEPWSNILKTAYINPTCWGFGTYNPIDIFMAYSSTSKGYYSASSYKNTKVDELLNKALLNTNEKDAIQDWKSAQEVANADFPFIWLVNIRHAYFIKDGLNIGTQIPHPHGHGMPIVNNLEEWSY